MIDRFEYLGRRGFQIFPRSLDGPFPEYQTFDQRVGGEPIGSHDSRRGQFAADKQTFDVGLSMGVRPHSPYHIMCCRCYGDPVAHIDTQFLAFFINIRKAVFHHLRIEVFEGQPDVLLIVFQHLAVNRLSDDIPGGQFGQFVNRRHKAFSVLIDQISPFTPDCLTD